MAAHSRAIPRRMPAVAAITRQEDKQRGGGRADAGQRVRKHALWSASRTGQLVVAWNVAQLRTAATDDTAISEPQSKKAKPRALTNDNHLVYKDISSRLGREVDLRRFISLKQEHASAIASVHAVKAGINECRSTAHSAACRAECDGALLLLITTANITTAKTQAAIQAYSGPLRLKLDDASAAAMEAKRLHAAIQEEEAAVISAMQASAVYAYNAYPRKSWGTKVSTCNINGVLGSNCPLPLLPAGFAYKPQVSMVLTGGLFNLNVLVRYEQLVHQRTGVLGFFSQGSGFTGKVGWANDDALRLPAAEVRGKMLGPNQQMLLERMMAS
ncbi:hypothetical protein COO60DRAFT_1101298 [Scenedesmus sp. NREL 46B-D3]|nr:hypothetical protein COO60DRAFT_1101298 [Scenedesmus sp. NREL 46B-D3]